MSDETEIRRAMILLRQDAIERGMDDLAIVYGWSAIRLGSEILAGGKHFGDPPVILKR